MGASVWAFMMGCLLIGPLLIYRRRISPAQKPKNHPSVCILRPLKGLDSNLERNLRTSFEQSYPKFEIICSVENEKDPALPVFLKVQKDYPNIKSRIIVGLEEVGVNPKVNNLVRGYKDTKAEIIWILDSNVTVDQNVLEDAVYYFEDPKVGLVHHIPTAVQLGSAGSFLDGAFLSCAHARMYSIINSLAVASCVIGKSNLYRKKDMDELGGIASFGKYLAEDNCIGIAFFEAGFKHVIARDFVYQSMGNVSIKDFISRRIRWIRVRKYTVWLPTLIEPFTECLVCGYVGSLYFRHYYLISTPIFMLFTTAVWFLSDMAIASQVYKSSPTKVVAKWFKLKLVLAWFFRELITLPVYIWAMAGSQIDWRNQKYTLKADGSAVLVPSKKSN